MCANNFTYQKFDEFTFPSADLQLAAQSLDAISRGEYRWIVSELHPAAATLHHCMYWSCPDHAALSRALQLSTERQTIFHFGFFAADFTAHTTVRIFDALPQQAIFASPQRGNPRWHSVSPAQAEVFIAEDGDVALRASGRISRFFCPQLDHSAWVSSIPIRAGAAAHRGSVAGRVIVQRRSWTVSGEEMGGGNFSGLSRRSGSRAIERLRAAKDWPRFRLYSPDRTGIAAQRRRKADDKDTKPGVHRSRELSFPGNFHRWLSKSGELKSLKCYPRPTIFGGAKPMAAALSSCVH